MTRYGRSGTGWYGNSHGHSLAARGISLYAKKPKLNEALFYAQKQEKDLPFAVIIDHVRKGNTYQQIRSEHPDADAEEVRLRGIKAVETMDGSNVLSRINRNGVDETVEMAKKDRKFRDNVLEVLGDNQRSSFIQKFKIEALRSEMRGMQ